MSARRAGRRRLALGVLLAVIAAAAAVAAPAVLRAVLWRQESNPVLRGRLLGERLGCAACHLPPGGVEIPNPGSRWGTVPRFGGGNAFMYAPERDDIAAFIRDGAPADWLADAAVRARLEAQRIRMPAFGARLGAGELDDLVAWVAAVEGVDRPGGDAVAAGRALAGEHGCLACHGVAAAGGVANPGSLGGFVPGFRGAVFRHLVRDQEEFRTWVLDGTNRRLASNPVVRYAWRRQVLAMPAYRGTLDDAQITALWRWVEALRAADAARR